ncbi:hypothetical protein Tco_1071146 [Tanacetum coccineum]|uniref:Reverse transcriptase domain-containing protein n=1 Tax=Tanacetum coccineum TaxID=301880 RepID=A0ABQ5HPU2_9ASTR
MVNVIPPDHDHDVPVVEPNQHDDVPIVLEPVLEDEDEDPKKDKFKEEEDPQEDEDDMEIDFKEDENKPELTYTYEEVDPHNPPPHAFESEPDNKIDNPINHEDETVPISVYEEGESFTAAIPREDGDRLLPGFLRRDTDSFFVRSSMEQRTTTMEKLVEKLENVEEKVECKKLKKELEEARLSNTFLRMQNERVERDLYWTRVRAHAVLSRDVSLGISAPMTQAAIRRMIKESVDSAIAAERARQANVRDNASGSGPVRGRDTAPVVRSALVGFMSEFLTAFLVGCLKKMSYSAYIGEDQACLGGKLSLELWVWRLEPNAWTEMKQLMTDMFCTDRKEITTMVDPERVRFDAYILGLRINQGLKVRSEKWETFKVEIVSGERCIFSPVSQCMFNVTNVESVGHRLRNRCPNKVKQEEVGEFRGRAYAIKDAEPKGLNVVTASHIFEINLMLIELGMFDVIIGMDWLVKHDAVIVYGEKVAREYVEKGCHLFLAHVTKKKSKEKRMEDVPVIRDFPEVFPEELPGLPPLKANMVLPPREQRHPFLRYQGLEYTDTNIEDFKARLARIYRREVHRVHVFDFGGLPNLMVEGLSAILDLDTPGALQFQLGGARRRISSAGDFLGTAPHLRRYLRLFAVGRKSGAHISGGQFVARLAEHFGLLTAKILRGLTVIAPKLPIIDIGELVRLQICIEIVDTWAWPPPPPPAAARTVSQRLWRLEEEVQGLCRDLMDASGLTYQEFDGTLRGSSPVSFQRCTKQRTGEASTSTAQQDP